MFLCCSHDFVRDVTVGDDSCERRAAFSNAPSSLTKCYTVKPLLRSLLYGTLECFSTKIFTY
jgi:hypothetical protein